MERGRERGRDAETFNRIKLHWSSSEQIGITTNRRRNIIRIDRSNKTAY